MPGSGTVRVIASRSRVIATRSGSDPKRRPGGRPQSQWIGTHRSDSVPRGRRSRPLTRQSSSNVLNFERLARLKLRQPNSRNRRHRRCSMDGHGNPRRRKRDKTFFKPGHRSRPASIRSKSQRAAATRSPLVKLPSLPHPAAGRGDRQRPSPVHPSMTGHRGRLKVRWRFRLEPIALDDRRAD